MKTTYFSLGGVLLLSALFSCNSGKKSGSTDSTTTLTSTSTTSDSTTRYIRYNVNTPEGQKALAAMDSALKIMRNMDCSNTSSWYYQGAMHWVPDTITVNPFCPSYTKPSDKKANWDNCTHFKRGIEINFLIWHRLYIYNFEKIVRAISHDPTFALPYWGYTDTTDTVHNRTLNAQLRNPKSSLYTASRYKELNEGQPLTGDILDAIDITKLNQNTDLYLYSKQIDAAPHGAMHDYIGGGNNQSYMIFNEIYQKVINGGLMANVPSAGFDPVFWLHHSNIDRIWQQWTNSPNGQKITVEDLKAHPFHYAFYNEKGQEVTYTPEQIVKIIYNLDYDFDDTKLNPGPALLKSRVEAPSVFLSAKLPADTVAEKKVMQPVKTKSVTFSVANKHQQTTQLFATKNLANKHKTVIVELTISVAKEPRGIYQVYINLPKGVTPSTKSDYFAGFITFFGQTHASMPGMDMGGSDATFFFDLTDEFAKTGALGKPNFDITILNKSGKGVGDFTVKEVNIQVK